MKCSACSRSGFRSTRRALIVIGPGKAKPGKVCNGCASTGILIVFGGDDPRPRKRANASRALLGATQLAQAMRDESRPALPPKGERCEAHTERTRRRCMLPKGHGGSHRSMLGGSWSETA